MADDCGNKHVALEALRTAKPDSTFMVRARLSSLALGEFCAYLFSGSAMKIKLVCSRVVGGAAAASVFLDFFPSSASKASEPTREFF